MPTHKLIHKTILTSGAALFVAIAGSLLCAQGAEATPNNVKADMRVNSIGTYDATNNRWCPDDTGPTLIYTVEYENVSKDQAYLTRVTFTTGSNQQVEVLGWDVDFTEEPYLWVDPVCHDVLLGIDRVVYCDVYSWNSMGGKIRFDFEVTTNADDLNVAASVSNLRPDGNGQGQSLMSNNYLEHAYNSQC